MSWESIPYWTKLDISLTTGQVMGRLLPNSSTFTAKYTYYNSPSDYRAGRLQTTQTWNYSTNVSLGMTPNTPLGTTTYDYNERGQILSITGNGTTPSAYTYDAAGRTTTLTTWRGAAGDPATAQVTTWIYSTHPTLPLVRSKKYPGRPIGIDYTYAADGSMATRDWERPDGSNRLRTTYSTNNFGQTTGKVIARNGLEYAFTSPDAANCLLPYNGFREPLAEMSLESILYWPKLEISPTTGQAMGRRDVNSLSFPRFGETAGWFHGGNGCWMQG